MSTMELEVQKASLAREILNITDDRSVFRVICYQTYHGLRLFHLALQLRGDVCTDLLQGLTRCHDPAGKRNVNGPVVGDHHMRDFGRVGGCHGCPARPER